MANELAVRRSLRRALGLGALAWLVVGSIGAGSIWAAPFSGEYPQRQSRYLTDAVGLYSTTEQRQELEARLERIHRETGIETVVVVIESVDRYLDEPSFERFATGLFNHWAIGDAATNRAVLLLVARGDRRVRIELGAGWPSHYDGAMREVIDAVIVPRFRQGRYRDGVTDAVVAIAEALGEGRSTGREATDRSDPGSASSAIDVPSESARPTLRDRLLDAAVWWAAAFAAVLTWATRRLLRFRPRSCRDCGRPMRRLDEQEDDAFLDESERLEEQLRSVDYDVWACATCDHFQVETYRSWWSPYKACTRCGYRTMSVDRHTVDSPTETSTGTREVTERCNGCGYVMSWTEAIPMVSSSDYDDSSSFDSSFSGGGYSSDGGYSSGGGASGSW